MKTRKDFKRGSGANCNTAGEMQYISEIVLVSKTWSDEGLDEDDSTGSKFKGMDLRVILKTASATPRTNWIEGQRECGNFHLPTRLEVAESPAWGRGSVQLTTGNLKWPKRPGERLVSAQHETPRKRKRCFIMQKSQQLRPIVRKMAVL